MNFAPTPEWVELADDGTLVASPSAATWLGASGELQASIVLDEHGRLVPADRHPAARALRGERLEAEPQRWIARATGARRSLLVSSSGGRRVSLTPLGQRPVLELAGRVAGSLLAADDPQGRAGEVLGRMAFALGAEALAELSTAESGLATRAAWGAWPRGRLASGARWLGEIASGRRPPSESRIEALGEAWAAALREHGMSWVCAVPFETDGGSRLVVVALRDPSGLQEDERVALSSAVATWREVLRNGRRRDVEARAGSGMKALGAAALETKGDPLRPLLRLLVAQACELTRARYGAMGVLNPEHTELADFVTVGMSDEQGGRIGHLPQGRGLLGAVIHEGRTLRVADLSKDPRASGFPAHHPRMRSFLGVPLRVGEEVFGNFYLTDKEDGAEFTEEDARLLEAFSAQAAVTVSYAREVGEQRRLLAAVLRQAPHGILFVLPDDVIAFSNEAARRMLGLPAEGPVRRSYLLQEADGRPIAFDRRPAARALSGEVIDHLEVQVLRADGSALPALASAAPVRSETGALLGAVVAFQDLTPFKELERVREEFAAVVAHDLRSPLQAMTVQLDALLRRAGSGEVRASAATLGRMRHAGTRLEHLIRDLLDAARIESDRLRVEARPVCLPALVRSLARQLAPTLAGHPITLDVEGDPPEVLADPLRLEQVLTNLVENAGKYSAEGSPIALRVAEAEGGGVAVSVSDRGPGIGPEDLPRLFDRYYQTARARQKRSGLGLGLFIAKGLAEAHGGRLTVESRPGVGSTFQLWLPVARAREAAEGEEPRAPA